MRANISTKKLISKYFSFYFLGKFETRAKAISYSFVISLIVMIMAVLTKGVLSFDNTVINILFPFTYMGTIGNLIMISKLRNNIENGIVGFERKISQTDSSKRTYETAKVDTFLSTLSLFTGAIELTLTISVANFLIILVLEAITVYSLFYKSIFTENDKRKKIISTTVMLGVIILLSFFLRIFGLRTVIPGNYIIVLTIMFAFVGFMKANNFVNYLFKKEKTNGYVLPLDNYENLKKEEAVKEKEVVERAFTVSSTVNSFKKAKKEAKEFRELCDRNYKEAHKGTTSKKTNNYARIEKEDTVGYSTDIPEEDDINNRFLARDKR